MSTPDRDLDAAEALRAELEAEMEAELATGGGLEDEAGGHLEADPEKPELTIAFSPRQILGGFALIAALIVLLLRRRKPGKG